MNNTTKRGRGRPKGSTSFIKVKLADLNANLGPNANIAVSKKWLEDIGFSFDEPTAPKVQAAPKVERDQDHVEEAIQFNIY